MLAGTSETRPLAAALEQLAATGASGCLRPAGGPAGEAEVFLRAGGVTAVTVPGPRPALGSRLLSSGVLTPAVLAAVLARQAGEQSAAPLGELLVRIGYVDPAAVEAFAREQVVAGLSDLLSGPYADWTFRPDEPVREDVTEPLAVPDALAEIARRDLSWQRIAASVPGDAVPVLTAAAPDCSRLSLHPEAWALLCRVDGVRSVAELGLECGFTLHEAGHLVHALRMAGLVDGGSGSGPAAAGGRPAVLASSRWLSPTANEPAAEPTARAAALSALLAPGNAAEDLFTPAPRRQPAYAGRLAEVVDLVEVRQEAARRGAETARLAEQVRPAADAPPAEEIEADNASRAGQARWAAENAAATAAGAFAELSAAAALDAPAPAPPVGAEPAGPPPAEPAGSPAPALFVHYDADTAALLRELSSLGVDDGSPAPAAPVADTPRPATTSAAPKRRKGLFGR